MTTVTPPAARAPEDLADPPRTWSCFVITPIGNEHAEQGSPERDAYEHSLRIFEEVVLPACSRYGVTPVRSDGIAEAGEITDQICRHVLQDDLVIADVGGGNPNVMYELGLRHATGKPVIHIGEHGRLPFDISPIRTIQFQATTRSGLVGARKKLEAALETVLRGAFEPLTPARILRGLRTDPFSPARVGEGEEDEGEDTPGLVERMAVVEEQMEAMTEDLDGATDALQRITDAAQELLPTLWQPDSPSSTQQAILHRFAQAIEEPAADLKGCAQRFADKMGSLDAAVRAGLAFRRSMPSHAPDTPSEGPADLLEQLTGMSASVQEGVEAIILFEAMFKAFSSLSRSLRAPGREITAALRLFRQSASYFAQWEHLARTEDG
ncbi:MULTISPECIES: hypothetical protein [unclassified Streptomyces]|uniref:hypothetical protein n=1 Tax=unclassified Streptomyces TaxID=2593676 RepID=UPI001BE697F9|nr:MULTISPECIES: hypothetical protein [unclassified Streptomyces]MBT2403488.1 hypothetical protein [Streptomyces sp. ISL-21]MBT2612850.1 hypothetical protein [Streptomyces sp. ISL-87]